MGYTKEIYTVHNVSRGIEADGRICFLSHYKLCRRPTGIHRFPDGGRVRPVFEKIALYFLLGDHRIEEVRELHAGSRYPVVVGNTVFRRYDSEWLIKVKDNRGVTVETVRLSRTGDRGEPEMVGMGRIWKLTEGLPPSAWGLPSPLRFCPKPRRRYLRDIVLKAADGAYRRAIIAEVDLSDKEVRSLLGRIEKRKRKLSGYAAAAYTLYIEPTEGWLRERLGARPDG